MEFEFEFSCALLTLFKGMLEPRTGFSTSVTSGIEFIVVQYMDAIAIFRTILQSGVRLGSIAAHLKWEKMNESSGKWLKVTAMSSACVNSFRISSSLSYLSWKVTG